MATPTADIGLIGLAVMGENLVLNMESRGYTVAVFNRTTAKVDEFVNGRGKGKKFVGAHDLKEFVASIKRPRKIMMMVKAGKPVDDTIAQVAPFLEAGDVLIDGGNTHFPDTTRRMRELAPRGIRFIGSGVSGGEEGALKGPSIMPGGDATAWPEVKPIFQSIAAKVKDASGAEAPCCDWVGPEGAGHFVKMVHNGIEYGDMQLICESYNLLKDLCGMSPAEMSGVFTKWNKGVLDSYLIEITADILAYVDPDTKQPLVDVILDTAGQKGTGKWTVDAATENAVPLTLIAEAVFGRCLSAQKDERVAASKVLAGPSVQKVSDRDQFIADVEMALYAAKIVSYAQGYALMAAQAKANNWELNNGGIALMWRGGCIIRSAFLGKIKEAFDRNKHLVNLMVDPFFAGELGKAQSGWRRAVGAAAAGGIPLPAISSALAYYDGYRTARLPANLLQAQAATSSKVRLHLRAVGSSPAASSSTPTGPAGGGTTSSTSYNA